MRCTRERNWQKYFVPARTEPGSGFERRELTLGGRFSNLAKKKCKHRMKTPLGSVKAARITGGSKD